MIESPVNVSTEELTGVDHLTARLIKFSVLSKVSNYIRSIYYRV